MKKYKAGNWSYKKSNNTLNFKSNIYSYELDMDKWSPQEWIKHISTTKGNVMSSKDIQDLYDIYLKMGFNIKEFTWQNM